MRQRLTIGAFLLLLSALGFSLLSQARTHVRIRQAAGEEAMDDVLDRRLAEVKFDDTPLDEAIDRLREEAHANIVVDWRVLDAFSLGRKAPVSLRLRDVRLSTVLRQVLKQAEAQGTELGYQAADGVITITTDVELAKLRVVRLYDITDLIEMSFAAEHRLNAQGLSVPVRGTKQEYVDEIIKLLEDLATVNHWGWPTFRELSGRLVVVGTGDDQKRVAALLRQLRESFRR